MSEMKTVILCDEINALRNDLNRCTCITNVSKSLGFVSLQNGGTAEVPLVLNSDAREWLEEYTNEN